MLQHEIRVGDKLRIRSWEDMAAEFGVTDGIIAFDGRHCFTWHFRRYCGMDVEVVGVEVDHWFNLELEFKLTPLFRVKLDGAKYIDHVEFDNKFIFHAAVFELRTDAVLVSDEAINKIIGL